jgi:hypothetical protein
MSFITDFFTGSGKGIIEGIGSMAKDIRAAITGESVIDPNKKAEIELKMLELENKAAEWGYLLSKAQTDINLEEAKNPNLFVSGWRPFIGWVCGLALGWQFIGVSLFDWIVRLMKVEVQAPALNTEGLITILLAMLGLGGMRTFEKYKGSQGNH